jgi:hypothetical protein
MSVRNGDQSKLNRDRKKKVARPKRTHELLERAAKPFKSRETIFRAHPRSVWA